jgi:hypothetical protein
MAATGLTVPHEPESDLVRDLFGRPFLEGEEPRARPAAEAPVADEPHEPGLVDTPAEAYAHRNGGNR